MTSSGARKDQPNAVRRLFDIIAGVRRYAFLIYNLGADIFKQFPAESIRILSSSAASLSCQILALGILFGYLRALESSQLWFGEEPRTSVAIFALVAITTVALFFFFALFEYRSNLAILRLCRDYQKVGTQEALSFSSRLPHWFGAGGISKNHLRQILSVDVHHRSRMARVLMRAVIPAARLVLSAAAVLYLNPQFSAIIFVVIGIPVAGLYFVGKKIADTITSRETNSQSVYQQQLDLLSDSWTSGTKLAPEDIGWDMALGDTDSRHRLFFARLRARALGKLLINTANTLGIMVLVLSLGFWMLQEPEGNWSYWLTYLVALRFFLSSLNRVAQAVMQSTRFNRQVRRFTEFMAIASVAAAQPDPLSMPCPERLVAAYRGRADNPTDDDDFDDD